MSDSTGVTGDARGQSEPVSGHAAWQNSPAAPLPSGDASSISAEPLSGSTDPKPDSADHKPDSTDPKPDSADATSSIVGAQLLGVRATVRRGVEISPQLLTGLWLSLALAVGATVGRILVPMAVQSSIDNGVLADGGPDVGAVVRTALIAVAGLLAAGWCSAMVNIRLFRSSESGLAELRQRAFARVHEMAVLTQRTEKRGALVSRVTSDVDTISMFVQWGGIMLLVSVLQVTVATVLMVVYTWQLALAVWLVFVPLILVLRPLQARVNTAYTGVRERTGAMLGAMSEAVVGAETIRVFGVQERVLRRIDQSIAGTRSAQIRAQNTVSIVFSVGVFVANGILAVVVAVGVHLGLAGDVSVGEILAFVFLVQLFTSPIQMATELLNDLQNAVAGWRRVIALVDTPLDVAEPESPVASPRGPASVTVDNVTYGYPGSAPVLRGVTIDVAAGSSVAVVGPTGSGKTTLARLVMRFVDPTSGRILLDGTDVRDISTADLRSRVVLVPQEGFCFDATLGENLAYGVRTALPEERVIAAIDDLGLHDWVAEMPDGLATKVGQRGERLSVGERQLVALVRAHLAMPDLLILDEATSSVDPATEVRLGAALASLTAGRTTIAIAHRLSTAAAADMVVVVDAGQVVEVGHHDELLAANGRYAQMYDAWVTQTAEVQLSQ